MVLDGDVQPADKHDGHPRKAFPKRHGTTGAQRYFNVPKIAQALHWDAGPATSAPTSSGYVMVPAAAHVLQRQPTARSSQQATADISHRVVVSRIPIGSVRRHASPVSSPPSPSIVSIPNATTFVDAFFTSSDVPSSPPRLQSSESRSRPRQSKPLISVAVGGDELFPASPLTPDRDGEGSFGSPGVRAWDRDTLASPIDMSNASEFLDSVDASEVSHVKPANRVLQLSPPSALPGPAVSVSEAGLIVTKASETPAVDPQPAVLGKRTGVGKPARTSMSVPLSAPMLSEPSPSARSSQQGSKLRKQRSSKREDGSLSQLAVLPPLAHSRPAPLTKPAAVSPSKLLSPTHRGSHRSLPRNSSFFSNLLLSPSPMSQYSRASDDSGSLRVSDLPQSLPSLL